MRLGRVVREGRHRVAEVSSDGLRLLRFEGDITDLIRLGETPLPDGGPVLAVDSVPLVAPVVPGKIVAIGLNYLDHVRESGMDIPSSPLVLAKFPSSIIGPVDAIKMVSQLTVRVDWEVELAVIIGRRMRDVPAAEALDHVFGYTVGNDVSARDLQFGDGQWTRGKSLDTFCPLGPLIVTPDELGDVQGLALTTRVNGEVVQSSSTGEVVFGVAELLDFCSR